jgi:ligand-binding sensor domain-containing protein
MWFGTKDGLCRFDGYDVKVFRSSALTPGKLTSNEIQCFTEDNGHRLWVGTLEGINIIDKSNYSIKAFDNKYVNKERINSLITDSKGYIWIGTSNYGAIRMNPKTGEYDRFSMDKDSPLILKGNSVTNIYEDRDGRIWLSLWKTGLSCIDQDRKKITHAPKLGKDDNPFRILQDKDGLYWICTWGNGVFNMSVDANSEITLQPMKLSKNSVNKVDDIVYSITQDDELGYIWLITYSGLKLIEKELDGTYKVLDTDSFFDETNNMLFHEISKDHQGNLWIGSVGEGLFKLDFNKLSIQNFPLKKIKSALKVPSYVTRFCELSSGEIYIVINRVGLFSFDPKTGEVKRPTDSILRSLNSLSAITSASKTNSCLVLKYGYRLNINFNCNYRLDLVF